MAIVEVRPIEKEKWHNRKGKDSFARPITIEPLVSLRTGQYSTGLTEEEQKALEEKTGFDLSPIFINEKSHPFWDSKTAQVKLEHKTNVFNTDRPIDEIKVKILKASDLIANSMKEYEEGKFPNALFVIFDEKEEVEVKAAKIAQKNAVIIELSKLTDARKAEIVQILSGISVKKQSSDYISLKLDEEIEQHGPDKVLRLIKRDKARTTLHAMVLEALQKNILRKEGTAFYYMDDQIGFDLEDTIDYLADKKNQVLKVRILEALNK